MPETENHSSGYNFHIFINKIFFVNKIKKGNNSDEN